MRQRSYPVGITLGTWQREHARSFDPLASAQHAAYVELMGHEPPAARSEEMAEQFRWPNAKRRKYDRKTLEQVAQLEVATTAGWFAEAA